jgi:hypothetical protein
MLCFRNVSKKITFLLSKYDPYHVMHDTHFFKLKQPFIATRVN